MQLQFGNTMCVSVRIYLLYLTWLQVASRITHEEAAKPIFFRNTQLMTVDEHPFDFALLAPSVLLYGHLGNLIAGDRWDQLQLQLSNRALSQDRTIKKELKELPADLTVIQRLSLTPLILLTEADIALLKQTFGVINPVDAYFSKLYGKICAKCKGSSLRRFLQLLHLRPKSELIGLSYHFYEMQTPITIAQSNSTTFPRRIKQFGPSSTFRIVHPSFQNFPATAMLN